MRDSPSVYCSLLRHAALERSIAHPIKPRGSGTEYTVADPAGAGFCVLWPLRHGAQDSAGTRDGTSGQKIEHASLQWAFSEAAVLFLRDHPAAQKYLARLEKKHGKGKALTILAQKLARAVYYMLKRQVAFDRETFFQR